MRPLSHLKIITDHFRILVLLPVLLLVRSPAAAGAASPGPSGGSGRHPDLVLITVDTLRADHLSGLNPHSPAATPQMDRLLGEGVAFLDASTTNPLTTPAHASLMTGLWPTAHGVRDFTGYRLAESKMTLAEVLRQAGYQTGGFVSAAVLDRRTGISQGFTTYQDGFRTFLKGAQVAQRPGSETVAEAVRWLKGLSAQPFFLWLHLYEPHDPYRPPEPYKTRYAGDLYSGEVAWADQLVGRFLDALRKQGRYADAVIALLSDHGEGLGEHGETKHGFFIYQSTMKIPWILRLPGGRLAGRRISRPVSIVDVFPTLLHQLQIPRPLWPRAVQGRSRYRMIHAGRGQKSTVYMESETPLNQFGWSDLRALRQGRYKFIEAPQPELYDLAADPHERKNLFRGERALALQIRHLLAEWEARWGPGTSASSPLDPELEARLRSLGYVGVQAPVRSNRQAAARVDPKQRIAVYEQMQRGVEAARRRHWEQALAELQSAARAEPRSAAIAASLALACRDAGRLRLAARWFSRVVQLSPDDVSMRSEFARLLLRMGRTREAKQQLQAILERKPQSFPALFNLATLSARQQRYREAIRYFKRAIEVRPQGSVWRSLGLSQLYAGLWKESERSLLEALRLDPEDRQAHAALAQVYRHLGEPEKARLHATAAKP